MARGTWGPWPSTRSAPASTAARANRTTFPRCSPMNSSSASATRSAPAPSAPPWNDTTTRSCPLFRSATVSRAASMSSSGRTYRVRREYENPATATLFPAALATAIRSPPTASIPAASRTASVASNPSIPKSSEWLFATFTAVNPASARSATYRGGVRKAKQGRPLRRGFGHLGEHEKSVTGPSRLPKTTSCPESSGATDRNSAAPSSGGRISSGNVVPIMMSPTAATRTARGRSAGAAALSSFAHAQREERNDRARTSASKDRRGMRYHTSHGENTQASPPAHATGGSGGGAAAGGPQPVPEEGGG